MVAEQYPTAQTEIDNFMVQQLDGTKNEWGWCKQKLGANAILAVSLAVCKAGASINKIPLYQHIANLAGNKQLVLPVPAFNVIIGRGADCSNAAHRRTFYCALERIKAMGQVLSKATDLLYNGKAITQHLRAMLLSADEQVWSLKKQSTLLSQLAAKTIPNGIHCLSMRLTIDYYLLSSEKRKLPNSENLKNPDLYHYAIFSDNVLAASVVVNSTIMNAKEPGKHVFHLVTDKLNFGAMNMCFLLNPENVDDFKWLNSSYCPVLKQLETVAMKE